MTLNSSSSTISSFLRLLLFMGCVLTFTTVSSQGKKDSLLLEINKETDDSTRANLLNLLVWDIKFSETDSALIYGQRAYDLSQQINNPYQIANSTNRIGVVYWIKGDYEKARLHLEEARDIYKEEQNEAGMLACLVNLGLINQNLGNHARSLEMLFDALRITDKLQDSTGRSNVLTNIGNSYYLMEDYPLAKQYMLESVELKTRLNHTGTIHKTQMNLGVIYQKQENLDSALYFYEHALAKAELLNDWKNIALSKANIGTILYTRDEITLALKLFKSAFKIYDSKQYENPYDMGILITSMSDAFGHSNQLDSAQYYAEMALSNALEIKNHLMIRDAYLAISENEQRRRNLEKALSAYRNHIIYRDSVFRLDNKKDMDDILAKYGSEKKEQQIQLQELTINQQYASNERRLLIIIGLSVLLIFLILTGWLFKQRMAKAQEMVLQRQQIEFKELQLNAIIESEEKERKRFSRDIHDSFGQLISILKLNVETIEKEDDRDKRHGMFEKSVDILNDMYGELKNVCFNLMPQSLVSFGLVPSINEFADRISQSQKIFVEVLSFDMEERLSEIQEISTYRIVQEWVNNIIKYSDATQVTIQLTRDDKEVTVTVEDNGMGFEATALTNGSGNGWKNIRSRTNLLKGSMELDTNPKMRGNMFALNIPLASIPKTTPIQA